MFFRRPPKVWADVPLVDPSLYPGDDWFLPWIHDLNGYSALFVPSPDGTGSPPDHAVAEMVDTIIQYILNREYQALRDGYGIVTDGRGRYWAMGWSVHLPALPGRPPRKTQSEFLGRLVTMSRFSLARQHAWFKDGLAYLGSLRMPHGTYVFPREILPEKKNTYWVGGTHCGLGENRRKREWVELESTYWALTLGAVLANRHTSR